MFVRNFYETFRCCFKAIAASNSTNVVTTSGGTTTSINGTAAPHYLFLWRNNAANMRAKSCAYTEGKDYCVRFGSGTTPAKIDDYKAESLITSGLSIETPSTVVVANGDLVESRFVYAVTNTSGSDITIAEMTLHAPYGSEVFVVDRTVLDEPITIAPGETATVTYTISATIPIPGE